MSAAAWWAISDEDFSEALRRAHDGEDPDVLRLEYFANSQHDDVEGTQP